ncbi:hypothetical protein MHM98_04370 [Psychrobium sp. MM17-31]|uniref:hypothetical protein n=1 Tax=Psychrobium sp. MM17-31 TaxID=2917758 RepID=UPI001EF62E49|nr:hypothetical protein [Psychrobium sp. MM17-31]MCG7530593.1 hypothetical protein [Psychrobium sp. MM17-31]
MITSKKLILASAISAVLVGCGGGGGSSTPSPAPTPAPAPSPTPAPTPTASASIKISGDLTPAVGESVALIATVDGERSDLAEIMWTQTKGDALKLVAANSAVLAFDVEKAGDYEFKVDFTTVDGKKLSETVSFTTTTKANVLNARRDFASREGNKVSFKLSAPIDGDGKIVTVTSPTSGNQIAAEFTNVSWEQTAGPTVIFDDKNTNPYTTIFRAPGVKEDTIATFSVKATHPDGHVVSDNVHLLIQDIEAIPASSIYDTVVAKINPAVTNVPMESGLKNCIYSNYFATPCSLTSINLIGQDHPNPTVDDIMSRVITSHPWMAENFRKFLTEQDPHGDFKKLLRSVSAVVISYDIRPSYYWVATGAIHLDPEDLWLTPEQRDVIDVAPDYRSSFGQELKYVMPWRYVKDNDYASSYYPREYRFSRTVEDLVPDLGSLLYHELAHANDTFPSSTLDSVEGTSIYNAFQKRSGQTIADKLTAAHPKSSAEMAALGQVNFRGAAPTDAQKAYTPDDVAGFFSHDNAPTEYAYSSIQEDVATLFDAAMMSARYGIERDEAVTSPRHQTDSSLSYILSWGQRGRITDPAVMPRSKYVFDLIFPELDSDAIYAALPAPRTLKPGLSWFDVLDLSESKTGPLPQKAYAAGKGVKVERPVELDLTRRYK